MHELEEDGYGTRRRAISDVRASPEAEDVLESRMSSVCEFQSTMVAAGEGEGGERR